MPENTFYYSQLALSIYQSCQLRFRRRYLDGLYWPRPTNEQIETGMDFLPYLPTLLLLRAGRQV
jgi:hypothetical protein